MSNRLRPHGFSQDGVLRRRVVATGLSRQGAAQGLPQVRPPRIEARGLTFQPNGAHGPMPIRDLDLDVAPGELLLVAGPTGCGKSTLLDLMAGLGGLYPDPRAAGRLTVDFDEHVLDDEEPLPPIRPGLVGHLHQEAADGLVGFDVLTSLAMPLEAQGRSRLEMAQRIDDALHRFGIGHLAHREVATLSGGEQKRVALAGIDALDPPLVLLDEPLAHLDPDGVARVVEDLHRLRRNRTVVVAEHRHGPLAPLVDRTLHLLAPPDVAPAPNDPTGEAVSSSGDDRHDIVQRLQISLGDEAARPGDSEGARLVARNLTVRHGDRTILDRIRMVLTPGVHGLLGANGAGKTTLLEALAGLRAVDEGDCSVDGVPLLRGGRHPNRRKRRKEALLRRRLQVTQQDARETFFTPTVRAELRAPLRALEVVPRPRLDTRVGEGLSAAGLGALQDRSPHHLSGGEMRRVQLLGALLVGPRVLFLDEPSHGLDADARRTVCKTAQAFAAAGGVVVVATHEPDLLPDDTTWWFLPGDGSLRSGAAAEPGAPGPASVGFHAGVDDKVGGFP